MISKEQADYWKDSLKDFPKVCLSCAMYRMFARCTLVEGHIYAMGTCKYHSYTRTGEESEG